MKIYIKKNENRIDWMEIDENNNGEWFALIERPERENPMERQIMLYNRVRNPNTSEYNSVTREQLQHELRGMQKVLKVENYESK
jgi:hypothetical protein